VPAKGENEMERIEQKNYDFIGFGKYVHEKFPGHIGERDGEDIEGA
jgi:hypothetical protein